MGFNPFSGRGLIALGTLGLSEGLGEDTMSKVPVLGALGGYESDEQKALAAKQEQMAQEAAKREKQNQQMRMQALGQTLMAFNPRNQMMAQMFGPQAAFSPQQFAQMASDPGAKPLADAEKAWTQAAAANPIDPKHRTRTGGPIPQQVQEDLERARENERRRQMIEANMQALPPGAAPLDPRMRQGARRF